MSSATAIRPRRASDRSAVGLTVCLGVLVALAPGRALGQRQSAPAPSLRAYRLEEPNAVRLDGALDEPAWRAADPAAGFQQREPDEGAPASQPTEVRVLYDDDYIYIGVRAFDSDPSRIVGRQLDRDATLGLSRFGPSGGDDAIEIVLDTFHDRRNAYYFATNPRGVQVDGLITDESESPDTNWDGVWEVRTQVDETGWSAEFAIPLRTIRYPAGGGGVWGFNVQRVVARTTEQSLWTSWSRDNEGLHRVSHAGVLTELEGLPNRPQLYVKPYVLSDVGWDYQADADGDGDLDGDLGADAKLGLGSGLVLDLTVNTDFAQVEADDQQVDLTRFNLFFPEKREFFLENAGIFEFGSPQFFGPPSFLLFFSRRIGLQRTGFADAQTVPIIGGARLTGRLGGQTVGFLNVTTGEEESLGAPVTNFAVARVKRDIGRRSYVGGIATHRLQEGGVENVAGGFDWNFWLSRPLVFQGFYARSSDDGLGGEGAAWRAVLDYTGDWFGWIVEHVEIGEEMRPGIGFVLRPDIAQTDGGIRFSPRPPIPGLRRIDFRASFDYVVDQGSRQVRDKVFGLTVSPSFDSGDQARLEASYVFQRLEEPFELTPGVDVPAGDYEDWRFEGSVSSSRSRAVSGELFGGAEGFWDGDRWTVGGSAAFNSPHVGLELTYSHNDIEVPAGAFTTDLVIGRIKLAASTRLFGNALLQYNSQSNTFSANLRVDFIHRTGSDLFIVFNERRDVDGDWDPINRAFIVKVTYLRWF